MTATIADVLDEAARILRRNGWHQGFYYDRSKKTDGTRFDQCRVCARGAINLASDGPPDNDALPGAAEAADALLEWLYLSNRLGDALSVADWNDKPGRTVDEVLAALEGAARAEQTKAGAA